MDKCSYRRGAWLAIIEAVESEVFRIEIAPPGGYEAAGRLRDAIGRALNDGQLLFTVDGSAVEQLQSALLAALIGADKAIRLRGGELDLIVCPEARETIRRCGLESRFGLEAPPL